MNKVKQALAISATALALLTANTAIAAPPPLKPDPALAARAVKHIKIKWVSYNYLVWTADHKCHIKIHVSKLGFRSVVKLVCRD